MISRVLTLLILVVLAGCSSFEGMTSMTGVAERGMTRDGMLRADVMRDSARLGQSEFAHYLSAKHANRRNDFTAAESFLNQILSKPNGQSPDRQTDLLQQKVVLNIMNGRFSEASAQAASLIERDETSIIANTLLAIQAVQGNNFSEANKHLGRIPDAYSGQFIKPLTMAWVKAGQSDLAKSIELLGILKQVQSFEIIHDLHQAMIYDVLNQNSEAQVFYDQVVELLPSLNLRYATLIGQFYARTGERDKARALVERVIKENPETTFADYLTEIVERPEQTLIQNRLTFKEGLAQAFYDIATFFAAQNRPRQALYYVQLARLMTPQNNVFALFAADLFNALNNLEKANAIYQDFPFDPAFSWTARLRYAENLFRLGAPDRALSTLRVLERERPERHDVLTLKGDIRRELKEFSAAIRAYSQAIERVDAGAPENWSLFYARGIAYERAGRWPQAEKDLKAALRLNPDQPFVLNYLGYSWIDMGINIREGKEYVRRAVELQPTNGYIVDSLGWAMYRLQEYDQAVHYLERAVELRPQDPVILDHLADAYWKVGRTLEAQYLWQQVLAFEPEDELRQQVLSKLDGQKP